MFYENDRLDLCFNNCNPETNGERNLIRSLPAGLTIFDVGCRSDSELLSYKGEVHYFDPVPEFIDQIELKANTNIRSYFNKFGLSSQDTSFDYFPKYQSFYNRVNSCNVDDSSNKIVVQVRKSKSYIYERDIQSIDFLKVDVEGHEPEVIMGFEEDVRNVKIVQFEYGGTYLDNGSSLGILVGYLESMGFVDFSYLNYFGCARMPNTVDHYKYCNVICFNSRFSMLSTSKKSKR